MPCKEVTVGLYAHKMDFSFCQDDGLSHNLLWAKEPFLYQFFLLYYMFPFREDVCRYLIENILKLKVVSFTIAGP
jgi:hypothetical protein